MKDIVAWLIEDRSILVRWVVENQVERRTRKLLLGFDIGVGKQLVVLDELSMI